MSPSVGVFFAFFEVIGKGKSSWVSLGSTSKTGILSPYYSSYKNFKHKFLWVKSSDSFPQTVHETQWLL